MALQEAIAGAVLRHPGLAASPYLGAPGKRFSLTRPTSEPIV